MMTTRLLSAVMVCVGLVAGCRGVGAEGGKAISLAGKWGFRMDREDKGVAEKWFNSKLTEKIELPGSMTEAGYGDEPSVDTKWTGQIVDRSWFTEKKYERYRQAGNVKVPFWLTPVKYYVGAAWYQRQIKVPEGWQGKRVVLHLERPHWETRVWVDDREVMVVAQVHPIASDSAENSLSVPHEHELWGLAPGEHRLTIRVDNRVKVNVGVNAHSVSDHTQTNWNGIVGKIELKATDKVWIEDVQVFPSVAERKARVVVTIGGTGAGVEGTVAMRAESFNSAREHKVAEVRSPLSAVPEKRGDIEVEMECLLGQDALLWSEFSPALYRLTVSLEGTSDGKKVADRKEVMFGLREIGVKGTQFAINGNPIFLRGTLECCIFPLTGYPPTDRESWQRILKIARAHGLNHLRFHSWCPPEAAFEVADEMGFIFQVEGGVWTTVGEDAKTDAWIAAEAGRIFRAYGNHPSFCLYTHGNEPHGGKQKQFLGDLINQWKEKDRRRMYTSGSGWPEIPENEYHVAPAPRGHQWGEGLKSRMNGRPPETASDYRSFVATRNVPVVSHEIGQWCVFPNLEEIKKYKGVTRARSFEIVRDGLAENGMLDQAKDFLLASGKLQALCYKEEIESAMRTPGMAGFALLDIHDFPGQGTALVGVLDPFWDSKGYVTAEEHHRYCAEVVPLARMSKRVWTSDETFVAKVEIANFGGRVIENAVPVWSVTSSDGKKVASGELARRAIPMGNCIELGEVAVKLNEAPAPAKLVLTVGLKGTEYENSWDVWVYPASTSPEAPADVIVVNQFDDSAVSALSAGKNVLLMPKAGTVKGDEKARVGLGFTPIFWNTAWTNRQMPHTLGILCDPKHPALSEFPTEYHSNWQWWELVSRGQAMILNGLPKDLRPIVQVIDDWNTNRRLGLVFEAKVGGGKLVVCSVDLENDLATRPVARQMRRSLLKYMNSPAFHPKHVVEVEAIRALFAPPGGLSGRGAKVIKASSEQEGYEASQAIDGDPKTIWHTPWQGDAPGYPHEIQIDLGKSLTMKGMRYLPRQDVHNGWAREFEVYVSEDGKVWDDPAIKGTMRKDANEKMVSFARPAKGRFVRFVAVSGFDGQKFATMAELDVVE